jgi:hypothetical protein
MSPGIIALITAAVILTFAGMFAVLSYNDLKNENKH